MNALRTINLFVQKEPHELRFNRFNLSDLFGFKLFEVIGCIEKFFEL